MAEHTAITWTDSTFNPWWGCAKVSPGCDNCYAQAMDHRTGGNHWQDKPRTMSDDNWRKPLRWQKQAKESGVPHRVFCGSMCDWADKNAPDGQRDRLWKLIRDTPDLQWQLLTKRAPNIQKYLPDDWGDGYKNVWLGVTIEDQSHGVPRIGVLREIAAHIRFLSIEPLIQDLGTLDLRGIGWVIIGGESGPKAREMDRFWVMAIIEQCRAQGVPVFFKQWGSWYGSANDKGGCRIYGREVKEWPNE